MAISEELQARIEALQRRYEKLQDDVAMTDVTQTLGDTASKIEGLPGQIAEVRDKGYVYASFLEKKAQTLNDQWAGIRQQINTAVRDELRNIQATFDEVDAAWEQVEAALSQFADQADEQAATLRPRKSSLSKMIKSAVEEAQQEGESADTMGKLAANLKGGDSGGGATGLGAALGGGASGGASSGGAAGLGAALGGGASGKSGSEGGAGGLAAGLAGSAGQAAPDESGLERLVDRLEKVMDKTEKELSAASERIEGLYGQVPDNVRQTMSQLQDIRTYQERAESATFEWLAGEDVYMVVKAQWKDDNDEPEGFLYVTNQRLVMEQQEKKGGFLGIGGKKVENKLWESPVGSVEAVDHEKKGMLGRIDLVHIRFGSGGPFGQVTIEVKDGLNAEWFASRLRRAVRGEIEGERGVGHDPAEVEALENAPTMCSVCGANFNQPLTRGMTQLECAYCGAVVRLGLN